MKAITEEEILAWVQKHAIDGKLIIPEKGHGRIRAALKRAVSARKLYVQTITTARWHPSGLSYAETREYRDGAPPSGVFWEITLVREKPEPPKESLPFVD